MPQLLILLCALITWLGFSAESEDFTMDLAGEWVYRLRGAPSSTPGEGTIFLPSTLDNSHKSSYNPPTNNTDQLRREFSFIGEASYSREIEIPENWRGKEIFLNLERTKPSQLKIDGKTVGFNSRISSPQKYDLSQFLSPGHHKLEIRINNADSIPPIVERSSHATSESTQTNWNGILGDITLEAKNPVYIKDIKINERKIPDYVSLNVFLSSPYTEDLIVKIPWKGNSVISKLIPRGNIETEITLPVVKDDLWDANHPVIHQLDIELWNKERNLSDRYLLETGFRKFDTKDNYFTINDKPLFLRGTVNAAVFPLTAHPPMDLESWEKYFKTIKDYGFNHLRFHSWTPPEAAFKAADKLGVYLMVELPVWGEIDRDLNFHNRFLMEELAGIMEAYSHHPSFVLFSPGNELWGDLSLMKEYMEEAKKLNPRILSTYGSNVYLGMRGEMGDEDFLVASKTSDNIGNSVRGSVSFADSPRGGHFNSSYPDNVFNFYEAVADINLPIISHEVGQYQTYPDFTEIEKYTGNLKPDNLIEFKRRAEEAGTLKKNKEYTEASGKWAAKLYKAEMEMALRSPKIGGVQLFGIQDYPGQGGAFVGILDPFMESKGFIEPENWRHSFSDEVIIAQLPKFSFVAGEEVSIPILTLNYSGKESGNQTIEWATEFETGEIETIPLDSVKGCGMIDFSIPEVKEPKKFTLTVSYKNGETRNEYDLWVFPSEPSKKTSNVLITQDTSEALKFLEKGKDVILLPDTSFVKDATLEGLFVTDFWNYRMFRTICDELHLKPSPGTLGLLINADHAALKLFPTENHTDWQWWPIVYNSRPLIIDRLPADYDPIVEVIDNVERNYRLSLLSEFKVGKGKLIILNSNLKEMEKYVEGRWLLESLKEYISSKECKPKYSLSPQQLVNLLSKPSNSRLIKELKNETYNSFH